MAVCDLCRKNVLSEHAAIVCAQCVRNANRDREYQRLADELASVLQEYIDLRKWVAISGGTKGPMGQDVIRKFAEMQLEISNRAENALAKWEGMKR